MTWPELVWKNLLRRPVRTLLTILGLAVSVGLIVALLSITNGVTRTAGELIHVGRADFGLFQRGISDLTRSVLPETLQARVETVPGVAGTAKIAILVTTVDTHDLVLVLGLDPSEFVVARMVVTDGARARGEEAMVGDGAARLLGVRPGATIAVSGRTFRVAGHFHTGNRFVDNGVALPLAVVQRLQRRPAEVATFGVQVAAGRRPKDVAAAVERRFAGLAAVTEPGQVVKIDTSSRLIVSAGWALSALALIVGGIGVTNTMAMSVFERTREIGILRAIGWKRRLIAALIVSEAAGISLLALGLGLLLGWVTAHLFTRQSQLGTLVEPGFTPGVFAWGLTFALGVALIGALYPTWVAVRLRPIQALRYE
ncbi:MAG: ABC transporter permease [Actinobacteria bacterium]|nr:ABC transporter permease [Actinomycetota bacterium]